MTARDGRPDVVVGIDYGTLSARAVVVRSGDGSVLGSAVLNYPHGVMDTVLAGTGVSLPPDWALHVPGDYIDVLRDAVPKALLAAEVAPTQVIGIGTDFTASTVLPVLDDGTPLCALPEFTDRPHAYVKLWKHHAAQQQAERITALAHSRGEGWLGRYGGRISSEWQFAKALQVLEEDPEIYERMAYWVEAADWIVWQLTGNLTRNACALGYKALYQDGRYPEADYLAALNAGFAGFAREKLAGPVAALGSLAGWLTAQAAGWTGIPQGTPVCAGNVDAHVTAPAAGVVEPGPLVAIMGTSTCYVTNSKALADVPGMCGVVDGGIVEGLWGYEAGQSGVGDIFGWFTDHFVPQSYLEAARDRGMDLHEHLSDLASRQAVGEHGLVALDWQSGNRSVLVDHELSGLLVGLTLATRPEDVYRALLEATAFGARVIVESLEKGGVSVDELVVAGGLLHNSFLMQIYSDVLRRPLSIVRSSQAPAVGSAIHAAVAAGAYSDVRAAGLAMGGREAAAYLPDASRASAYDALFEEYRRVHDYFGSDATMHRLRRIRRAALATKAAPSA